MTLLLRPLNVETLSTYIYQFATRGSFEEGAPAALLIVAVGILPIIWIVRQAETSPHSGGNRENPDRTLRTRKSRRTRSPFQR